MRSRRLKTYAGIVIFTLYLIFDFNMLEKRIANGDESWGTAVQIAVNIYLDIINLFLYILRALAESNKLPIQSQNQREKASQLYHSSFSLNRNAKGFLGLLV